VIKLIDIEDVEEVLSKTWLSPPKNVIFLDGIIDVPVDGIAYAIGAQKFGEDLIVLTPLSTRETVLHETIHKTSKGIIGEFLTSILGKILIRKQILSPVKKEVKYIKCQGCEYCRTILERLRLQPAFVGLPNIRHYRLVT
jgi:hypothetical protein